MGKHSARRGGLFAHNNKDDKRKRREIPSRGVASSARRGNGQGALSDPEARKHGPLESAPPRLKAERDRRSKRTKRVALGVLGGVLAVLAIGAIGAYAYLGRIQSTMQGKIVDKGKLSTVLEKAKPQKPFTILLLGADYRPGEVSYRSDVMMLVKVDPEAKKVWMISIPRDTRVEIPGHGTRKINQAHAIGGADGPAYAVQAVEDLTGVSINHYMELNFRGFERIVDSLGGVWVDVPVEIDDNKADYHPDHRAAHIDPGYQKLDGAHALTFVRSRDFPNGDFARMEHQQLFLRALADQAASMGNVAKVPGMVSAAAEFIKTDMSVVELIKTALALQDAGGKNVYTASLKGEWKTPYVYLDEEWKDKVIADFEAGRSFDGSDTPAADASGKNGEDPSSAPLDPKDITVTIRNGAGIAGSANQASSIVKAQGFDVRDVGNANQFVYDTTLVVYKDDRAAAELVAETLPRGARLVESRGMYSFSTDVLVVIGKDWDVSKVPVAPVETN